MDTAQWPQDIVVKPMESNTSSSTKSVLKATDSSVESCRPHKEQVRLVFKCPRCNSSNTKFCYYNNYSLSQPRYFCKTCRRYWTEGGSLRNNPVGGSSSKNNKRSSSSSPSSCIISQSSSKKPLLHAADHDHLVPPPQPPNSSQNPHIKIHDHECQDLNLGFSESTISNDFKTISQLIQVPNFDINNIGNNSNNYLQIISPNNSSSTSHDFSTLELLTGIQSSKGFNNGSFVSMLPSIISTDHHNPNTTFYSSSSSSSLSSSAGLTITTDHQYSKPVTSSAAISFSLDNELGSSSTIASSGRLLFPFEDLKVQASNNYTTPTTTNHDSHEQHNVRSEGFWNGMLGTGGSW